MKRSIKTLPLIVSITSNIILFFIVAVNVHALEKVSHQYLMEQILKSSTINNYLVNNLGFAGGIKDKVNGEEVLYWFKEGGKKEDEPMYTRSLNHFHDPLKPWDSAGFKGTFKSSVIWAQDQGMIGSLFGGDWSWKKARDSFYKGLTTATKTERENNLADTFRALGQVMHLVQDSSVPAHVRNDAHIYGYHYEKWVEKNHGNLNLNPISFDKSILDLTPESSAPIPIANIFDTNKYKSDGSNPNVTIGSNIGISEFTNANFFSEDTIFKDYPHPAKENTDAALREQQAEDGEIDRPYYITGYQSEKLALYSYFKNLDISGVPEGWKYNLDDEVYKNYASLLIPRAVGYSAGLLNYFFRGTLEITAPDTYVYSIIDGSANPQQFTKIKAKVKNTTPNEQIQAGVLQAVAKYKKRTDYAPDLSTDPPTQTSREPEYSYSVSAQWTLSSNEISSINTSPVEFTFDFTNNPIPAGITDLYLFVVFKGTLGNETDTAIAAGMTDLKEPTHHIFWNLTDRFSLGIYNDTTSTYIYHLYKSDEIKNNPDLAELVDKDGDGIFNEIYDPINPEPYIDTYYQDFKISYMSSLSQEPVGPLATVQLPPGRHIRLIILVDRKYNNYVRMGWSDNIDTNDAKYDTFFEGVVNQETNGNWQAPTPIITFRQIRAHFYTGVLRCEPITYDPVTRITYCPYPEEPAPADTTPYQATINFQ